LIFKIFEDVSQPPSAPTISLTDFVL